MAFINYCGTLYDDKEQLFDSHNRAWRYGEGLIETMFWNQRGVRLFEDHAQRLQRSLSVLHFPAWDKALFAAEIDKIAVANSLMEPVMLRAQFFIDEEKNLQFLIEQKPLPQAALHWKENGLRIGIADNIQKNADSLSALKTTSRLTYSMAAQQAQRMGWGDALLLNANGNVVESTICNIFCMHNGEIITPPLSEGCIAGIMRGHLLERKNIAGMIVREQPIDPATLLQADAIFLTNAVRGIQPVAWFGDKACDTALCRQIFEAIDTTL